MHHSFIALVLFSSSLYAQDKLSKTAFVGSNEILLKSELLGEDLFRSLGQHFLENGFEIESKDEDFLIIISKERESARNTGNGWVVSHKYFVKAFIKKGEARIQILIKSYAGAEDKFPNEIKWMASEEYYKDRSNIWYLTWKKINSEVLEPLFKEYDCYFKME